MSRIHEALKKAEQERVATQGLGLDTQTASIAPQDSSVSAAFPPSAPALSATSQFTIEALQSRCAQTVWNPDSQTMLFFHPHVSGAGLEEFRTLRSRLYHLREKMPLKKILIGSSLPREGKSFVAANLAQVLVQQHGRRVLLLDGDLREPKLHVALGTPRTPGLSDYLMGNNDEFSVVQRGPMSDLFFIAAGHSATNPAELVANGRLKLLLARLEPVFDWIVIDSPAAVPVADASLLANFCDGILMVVRSSVTPFDAARKARQEFQDKQIVGVVLNGIDAEASNYSRYYYYENSKQLQAVK